MTRSQLDELVAKAMAAFEAMSPEQQADMRREQRRSFVLAEMEFGSDADEAAMRSAMLRGDAGEIDRLTAEGKRRRMLAEKQLKESGLW